MPVSSEPDGRAAGDYQRVRDAILQGLLEPGEEYTQADITAIVGVSRTPLREAVRRLQSEGLLEINRNRRLRVAPLGPDDLCQLYAMRIVLEPLGVRLTVPRLTPHHVGRLEAVLAEHARACESGDLVAAREPHREFHALLFAHAGPRMIREIQELWDHAQRYRRLYFRDASDEFALFQLATLDHHAIFDAAAAKDAPRCSELVAQHLARTALTVFAHVDGDHDPIDLRVALRMVRHGSHPRPMERP